MEYRDWTKKDGSGRDISTSLLGYGCMRFPTLPDGRIDEVRAEKLLNTAREAGVNYFDTAFPYHGGESEPFVGRVIAKWPRESFYLATKLPVWSCKTLDEAKDIFEKQFERLGVDYIDFYLLHSLHKARYDAAKEMGIVDWLWEQKAAGRIRNFGFSCHDNAAGFEHILRDQPWDFCQLQYNYLDTDDRAEEIAGDRGYALTEELNVPLIIMEPIKGGTLAQLPPDAAAPLNALDADASAASWALRWVAAPAAATVCPAPWAWTFRTISASGISSGCSAIRTPSASSGQPASRMPKRPFTASAAASVRPSAPSICRFGTLLQSSRRNWTIYNE